MAKNSSEEAPASSGGTMMILLMFAVMFIAMKYVFFPTVPKEEITAESTAIGKPLVSIQLNPLTGDAKPIALKDLKGKVSLINYWGFWCPPCRIEFPHLVEIEKDFRDKADFQFVSVSCSNNPEPGDESEIAEATTTFLKTEGATFPTYCDPWGKSKKFLAESIGADSLGYPMTVLVDREGSIAGLWMGYKPGMEKDIAEKVDQTLREKESVTKTPDAEKSAEEKPAPAAEEKAKSEEKPAAEAAPAEAAK